MLSKTTSVLFGGLCPPNPASYLTQKNSGWREERAFFPSTILSWYPKIHNGCFVLKFVSFENFEKKIQYNVKQIKNPYAFEKKINF